MLEEPRHGDHESRCTQKWQRCFRFLNEVMPLTDTSSQGETGVLDSIQAKLSKNPCLYELFLCGHLSQKRPASPKTLEWG